MSGKRHSSEQIIARLREADGLLAGGMKSSDAKRLKEAARPNS